MEFQQSESFWAAEAAEFLCVSSPLKSVLQEVFVSEVDTFGEEILDIIEEVLDYKHVSAMFNGKLYSFQVYHDTTLIDNIYDESPNALAEVDTKCLYKLVEAYLVFKGIVEPFFDDEDEIIT